MENDGGSASILIVDDASFMRRQLRDILVGAGYQIAAEGEDGVCALELYEKHRPDLVTIDLVMPRMTGMEALKELRQRDPEARVIVCSSISDEPSILQAIGLGARDYILKPIDSDKLLNAVKKALIKQGR